MSRRLQIIMDDSELARFRQQARKQGMTLSEWARAALRRAAVAGTSPSEEERLRAIDLALECNHPTADIDDMLADIERGRDLR